MDNLEKMKSDFHDLQQVKDLMPWFEAQADLDEAEIEKSWQEFISDKMHSDEKRTDSSDYVGRPLIGFTSLFFGGCYWIFLATQPAPPHNGIDLSFPIAFVLVLLGFAFILDLIPTTILWIVFKQNHQIYSEPYQAIFDKSGMTVQRQNASANYEWNFFKDVVEGRDEFILIYGKNLYFAIPKTSFQGENEVNTFRDMLKIKLVTFRQKLRIPMDIRWKTAT